ncbi:MAG: hypothetical protein K5912_02745 [Alphaproteobacteria bacterium]|nr:hypothetical protein [Alphaproteobacteria bacterium]
MKKLLIFAMFTAIFLGASVDAAVRDGNTNMRTKSGQASQQRVSTTTKSDANRAAATRQTQNVGRSTVSKPVTRISAKVTNRNVALSRDRGATRSSETASVAKRKRFGQTGTRAAAVSPRRTSVGRVAAESDTVSVGETKIGAAYEKCKSAYFQCMDQFCSLKNEEYRRCSCSDRVIELGELRDNLDDTNAKLTVFTENLDVVGMTAAQATAMHKASDGENALTADTSASKALLQAIMNSISGKDTNVAGKMSDLNSINISFDTANAFGITDSAQLVAAYNGSALYSAVYPNCRNAVRSDCTDSTLQRAITAYLMSVEQDCNTVQTAISKKQKELKAAVREGSAMLDLARVENRKKHNADNFTACLGNVEAAVLSEEVCGAGYHKCLDNGEYIDVTTGAPLPGVVGFYNLGKLLTFNVGADATEQRLSTIQSNRVFVTKFENKTKKFAKDALDKCSEISDTVWSEYVDKALLAIYYAQQSKVETIKTGCIDLITACYKERDNSITEAMKDLIDGTSETSLMPDKISLTQNMCDDYVGACTNMFDNQDIIADYVNNQKETDTLAACRAVVQQCFTRYGGENYENFYNPSSGLFEPNTVDSFYFPGQRPVRTALDWFSLYEYGFDNDNNAVMICEDNTTSTTKCEKPKYKSICAQEVAKIDSCTDKIEKVFGGLDSFIGKYGNNETTGQQDYEIVAYDNGGGSFGIYRYGYGYVTRNGDNWSIINRRLRPNGVATEVYNNIIDILQTQCMNVNGRFIEKQFISGETYVTSSHSGAGGFYACYRSTNTCQEDLYTGYGFWMYTCPSYEFNNGQEYICPKDYDVNVDGSAWGICSCWGNGGRRSKNGLSSKCLAVLPVRDLANDAVCDNNNVNAAGWEDGEPEMKNWCSAKTNIDTDQVCPFDDQENCTTIPDSLPKGINSIN